MQQPMIDSTCPEAAQQLGDFFAFKDMAQMPHLQVVAIAEHEACEFGSSIMTDLIFKLTVNELCAVIRTFGIAPEPETMLAMLESLVIAGEIALPDFMQRIQNLFPHIFAQIDSKLLETLNAHVAD